MSVFDNATSTMMTVLRRHAGTSASYRRGATAVSVTVVAGRSDADLVDEDGIATRMTADDWIVSAASITSLGEPKVKDRIVVDGRTYEVMSLGTEGPWRFTDQTRTEYRIHTRRV